VLTQRQVIESSGALVAHGAHLGGLLGGVLFILTFVQGGTWAGAEPWWQRISERWNERKVVTIDGGARAYPRDRSRGKARKAEFVEEDIDSILDKISAKGMDSLTDKERAALDKAAKK
jgi:hypothetical protein